MPRMGRLHVDGGCYHVMGRGLERRYIFGSDADKQDFLERLSDGLAESEMSCLAWSVMSNHYHLLLRVGSHPLSDLMRRLLSGFATAYNRRHRRVGYVFQNRFKSILCDEETYLLQLLRYIHLNPVKANVIADVEALNSYDWTGHAALMGFREVAWQETAEVLARFGSTVDSARVQLNTFMKSENQFKDFGGGGLIRSYGGWESLQRYRSEHETKIGDERILGDSSFVENILASDNIDVARSCALRRLGWSLEELIARVCDRFEIDSEQILSKGKQNNISHAKGVIAYFGLIELGLSSQSIAARLALSRTGVYAARNRGHAIIEQSGLKIEDL